MTGPSTSLPEEKKPLLPATRSEPYARATAGSPPAAATSAQIAAEAPVVDEVVVVEVSPKPASPTEFAYDGRRLGNEWTGNLQSELSEDALFADAHKSKDALKKSKAQHMESFDYDFFESRVNQQHELESTEEEIRALNMGRWIMTFGIGIGTAGVACFIEKFTDLFSEFRKDSMEELIASERDHERAFGMAFLTYAAISIGYVSIATYCVAILCPVAGGSGISEIKATLNGIKIHRIVRLKTLFCKAIGILFSVSAGLPVGKEGPMIHSGSIIGAGLSQGKSSSFGIDTSWTKFKGFRNDKEKRDFISCGAAAGVGAAFGAPIGGVLFALEEGASFWHQNLTWRTFFCAMVSAFIVNLYSAFRSEVDDNDSRWGHLGNQTGTLSFGSFVEENKSYAVWDVPIFLAMGMLGGLMGAVFNQANTILTNFRRSSAILSHRYGRYMEAIFICFVMTITSFWLSYAFGTCLPKGGPYEDSLVQFYCADGEYNDLASLYTVAFATSMKQLFHYTGPGSFTLTSLLVFFSSFYVMACWTYGIAVPSGLFVPSLLAGAAYGRIWVLFLEAAHIPHTAPAGMFSLIGAASMLGGMARMTISLTVIILECTGVIEWGLPIMVCLMMARWVGNSFNHGLYDIHIHLKHLPFLEFDPPFYARYLRVANIMGAPVVSLDHISKAGAIYDILRSTAHSGFAVVAPGRDGDAVPKFVGIIQRKHLCVMLQRKDFSVTRPVPFTRKPASEESFLYNEQYALSYRDIESTYPRFPSITEIRLDSIERELWMDLTPYMNPTPHTVQDQTPVPRAFRLFRSLGLRHLIVLNRNNEVKGIISRKDLTEEHLKESLEHLTEMEKVRIQGYFNRNSRYSQCFEEVEKTLLSISDNA
ncbi:Chloride Channel (ClC) Family [Achlya hypogyna]|uniref:Chloride channel protein n=1 Tax=Achlya hypogyna TaxID=1202772 RepID=A0A1V9YCU5_ACHHY|nr:Chloride Channel (ClC) Family [Achlya hypogyna]